MNFEELQKQLQDWTNKIPLVILGSGASVPYNLPGMGALGEHLKKSITFVEEDEKKQFEEFVLKLDKLKDLEMALHDFALLPKVLDEIIIKTWELMNKYDIEFYDKLVNSEIEFPLIDLTKYLISSTDRKFTIITTNYDRLAEYAASIANAIICNGFAQNYYGKFSDKIHQSNFKNFIGYDGLVRIWKVHGSLDWFKTKQGEDIQLPLRRSMPKDLKPSIVTPGLSKYLETQLEPFRTILTQADSEIEKANGFLCIGYGFNDVHVQPKLIAQIKNNKPIIVITKEITTKAKDLIINKCKNYILFEEAGSSATRVYSSSFATEIIQNRSCWSLSGYLKLIKD